MLKALGQSPAPKELEGRRDENEKKKKGKEKKADVLSHICNPWACMEGGSGVQCHHCLHSELEISSMTLCPKEKMAYNTAFHFL